MLDSQPPDTLQSTASPVGTITPNTSMFQLETGSDIIDLPFIFEGGHIIIDVTIDDKASRPFVLDSGAVDSIDRDIAPELGIETSGRAYVVGFGPNKPRASFGSVAKVQIGRAVLRSVPFITSEFPNGLLDRGSRPRIAGLIGAEFFDQFVVRIDYTKRTLRLYPQGNFHFDGSGFTLPLTSEVSGGVARGPHLQIGTIPMTIDGVAGDFIVDTGAGGQVNLQPAFMQHNGLGSNYPNPVRFLSPGGIGGHFEAAMALGKIVSIGTLKLSTPLVLFPTDERSVPMSRRYAGAIGGAFLRNFVVTLDFRGQHIYFESTGQTQLTQAVFGTGLILDKPRHTDFEIIDILAGSGAEQVGVRRGDRIVKIEGQPASDLGLPDFAKLNQNPARQILHIETEDGRPYDLRVAQILP